MSETLLSLEFTEQGKEGLAHVVIPWYGSEVDESRGGRSHGESGAEEVFGRVQARGSAGGQGPRGAPKKASEILGIELKRNGEKT